ncbi:MAG: DUF4845 domain-containing protein [Pseudomonadales bacterium]|nr:DUF4845 domain-containing protein [Pseudomonadales bacterium]
MKIAENRFVIKMAFFQSGASMYASLLMLVLLGLFLTSALKLAPSYMDNNVITNAMEGVIANNDLAQMNINDIRQDVMKTLLLNNIRDFKATNIQVVRENGRDYVDINYESRVHLFYNIDAVLTFQNRFDKNAPR